MDEIESGDKGLELEKNLGRLLGDLLRGVDLLVHLVKCFFRYILCHFLVKNYIFVYVYTDTNFFDLINDILKTLFQAQALEVDQVWLACLNDESVTPTICLEHRVVTFGNNF